LDNKTDGWLNQTKPFPPKNIFFERRTREKKTGVLEWKGGE